MASTAGSNKIMRIIAPVIGLGIGALVLYQQFGPPKLPACDAKETREAVQGLLGNVVQGAPAASVENFAETAFDEPAERRSCTAQLKAGDAAEPVTFTVSWEDKDDSQFAVTMATLARCDRSEIVDAVKALVTETEGKNPPARTLAALDQIAEAGLDGEKELRNCTAMVKFEGSGEQPIAYEVKWSGTDKAQYYVDLFYRR